MKKMLEELKNLDIEETYDVPITFRKSVIERIQKEEKHSKMKYIISALSTVAVVIVAVVVVAQGRIKSNREEELMNEDVGFYDITMQKPNEPISVEDTDSINDSSEQAATPTEKLSSENVAINMKDYYAEIVDLLNINGIEAKYENDEVKAKDNIENVKMIFFYYEDMVEMEQDGEYVIIK